MSKGEAFRFAKGFKGKVAIIYSTAKDDTGRVEGYFAETWTGRELDSCETLITVLNK